MNTYTKTLASSWLSLAFLPFAILAGVSGIAAGEQEAVPEASVGNGLSKARGQGNDARPSRMIIGTWSKQRTREEDHLYPEDTRWRLAVTFCDDGRFVWDSRWQVDDGEPIDESLTGTYEIERGFLVTYLFKAPSKAAQEHLTELFSYWPNQLLGQHTFKLRGDSLVLGHDNRKLWIQLQRESESGPRSPAATHAPLREPTIDGMMEAIHGDIIRLRDEYPWLADYVDRCLYQEEERSYIAYMPPELPGEQPKCPDQMHLFAHPFESYRPYRHQQGAPTVWRIAKMDAFVRSSFVIREPYGAELEEKIVKIVGRRCVELRLLLDER